MLLKISSSKLVQELNKEITAKNAPVCYSFLNIAVIF